MTADHERVDAAVERAARCFVESVEAIRSDQWDEPGLGEWTIRELVGHCARAFSTIVNFVENPLPEVDVADVGAYVRSAVAMPGIHAAVAERGHEAGRTLGDDPVAAVRRSRDQAMAAIDGCTGDEIGSTAVGGMLLDQYLRTRVIELVVHTTDICDAAGLPLPDFGAAAELALVAVVGIPDDPQRQAAVLRALLGRGALPDGFNLFG